MWALLLITLAARPARVHAEFSESQKQTLIQLHRQLKRAGVQYKRREFREAGESVKAAEKSFSDLILDVSDADRRHLKNVYRALQKVHALLELEGVSLPPLPQMDETISFAGQIAPVLARECLGCHGSERSQNGLSFANFATLLKGGESGPIIDREMPDRSLLLTKLLGTGPGQRMPLDRPPLADAVINTVRTWIHEGATFDGKSPEMTLASVVARYQAGTSTHEELAQERVRLARRNWKLALPESQPNMLETEHFLVVGNRSREELFEIATLTERQAAIVRKLLRGPTSVPFIKGRATLFVVDREYDYVEFGKMVEQRQLPKSQRAHRQYSLVDAYVVIVSPLDTEVPKAHLAEQIASLYVAHLGGDVPAWFATGLGRVVAARIAPRDPLVLKWKTPISIGNLTPADFFNGQAPPETSDRVFFAFSQHILRNRRAFSRLTAELSSGQSFPQAWESTYGATPQEVLAALIR